MAPLGSLQAFEAVARRLSFRAAAEELGLSPSAVSHAVSKLEKALGAVLIDRGGRRVALTSDGEALFHPLEEAFGLIRSGLASVSARQSQVLRLHVSPSFAAQWLSPRLSDFLGKHPGVEVTIAAGADYTRFTTDEFDADIVYNKHDQEGLVRHPLGTERVRPLCSPALAERIRTPADLFEVSLIRSPMKKVAWEDWFEANGLPPAKSIGMRFDRSFMSIVAAVDGLGVCLESTLLAERELASGRLVAPLPGTIDLTEDEHCLIYPRRNAQRPVVVAFTRWLLGGLEASVRAS